MSNVAEVEAALAVAFGYRDPKPGYVMTCDRTSGSALLWRLHAPTGRIMSTTTHHWAAAGAVLNCWLGNVEHENLVSNVHWNVLQHLYPPGYLRAVQDGRSYSRRIARRSRLDPPEWTPTPHMIEEATMPTGVIDALVTYLRQQHAVEPTSAEAFLAALRGEDLVDKAFGPLPKVVVERPDYEAFEAALAEAERLTS